MGFILFQTLTLFIVETLLSILVQQTISVLRMATRSIKNELIGFGYAKSECDEINKAHNTSLMIPDGIILIIIEYVGLHLIIIS